MILRPAEPGDGPKIRQFRCGTAEVKSSVNLERWIQRKALGWTRSNPKNHFLELLIDDQRPGQPIIGMYAFEPGEVFTEAGGVEEIDPDEDPIVYWFVKFVARDLAYRGDRLGYVLLVNCLDRIAQMEVRAAAYWKVHSDNPWSHEMSAAVGAERDPTYETAKKSTYFIAL